MPDSENSLDSDAALTAQMASTLQRLRQLSQQSIQAQWHQSSQDEDIAELEQAGSRWAIASLNERQHIAWGQGQQVLWLYQRLIVPARLNGYPLAGLTLRLGLTWWAEQADIFVNGRRVQQGDLFDCFTRLCLTPAVTPGQQFQIALRLVSPRHDPGALVRSQLFYELPHTPAQDCPEPGFVADELAVLCSYIQQFDASSLSVLTAATELVDWQAVKQRDRFQQSLAQMRDRLLPLSQWLKQRQIHCVGHAHLDLAWLWPIADTWDAAQRTFASVLALQKEFPELTYTHSSPALFDWLEHHRPDLFEQVQQQVAAGHWAIDAGLWVEPELNIISGESIGRQILYGQRYCREKFGRLSSVAWLPDSFGFCWQLPQLLKLGGIRLFATQKLRWNDTTQFPHELFNWQAPDGSFLLSLNLPPIGSDLDPIAMADYACQWESQTQHLHILWLPGMGDHGGGPTRDMLEKFRRWAASPFFPTLQFSSVEQFLEQVDSQAQEQDSADAARETNSQEAGVSQNSQESTKDLNLPLKISPAETLREQNSKLIPTWYDELYLELHRGCYTTHAEQKWFNRRCEDWLYQAELWAAIASLTADLPYPRADLEQAWKQVLFNQFHDILPGTAIAEVFTEANQGWQAALQSAQAIAKAALRAIAAQVTTPAPPQPDAVPVLVFNSLAWQRSEVVEISLPIAAAHWQVLDSQGQCCPSQPASPTAAAPNLLFLAEISSVGYQLFWLTPQLPNSPTPQLPPPFILQNLYLQATLDPQTGDLIQLYDRTQNRELLSAPANQLQAFQDQGQYWDAWNIAPDYLDHPLPPAQLTAIEWIEAGPVRQRLRVTRQLGQSTFVQDYVLDCHSPRLVIETTADWQETQVVLKVAFPLAVEAEVATYEIPFGAIARLTRPQAPADQVSANQAPADQAKWEVPALRWADLSDSQGGLSILTDCKHGFDAAPSQLRLTLLKSPLWPDPASDRGQHRFTYALYPHAAGPQQTPQQAKALNIPLQCLVNPALNLGKLPPAQGFLTLKNSNLMLSAFKASEDAPESLPKNLPDTFILRLYETGGQAATLELKTTLPLNNLEPVNLLEQPIAAGDRPYAKALDQTKELVKPWQICSYRLSRLTEPIAKTQC